MTPQTKTSLGKAAILDWSDMCAITSVLVGISVMLAKERFRLDHAYTTSNFTLSRNRTNFMIFVYVQ
jgi:hypothetical protein